MMGLPNAAASTGVWPSLWGGRLLPTNTRSASWASFRSSPVVSPTATSTSPDAAPRERKWYFKPDCLSSRSISMRRSAWRGTMSSVHETPRSRAWRIAPTSASASPGHVDEPSSTRPGGRPSSRRSCVRSSSESSGMLTSSLILPVVKIFSAGTPSSRKRAASCAEHGSTRVSPSIISRAAGPNIFICP